MNWYARHIGDWLKKTSHLTLVQEGVYVRLIDWCYANERPLPRDVREVRQIARARAPAELRAVATVLGSFFEAADDGWHNKRVQRELARFNEVRPSAELKRIHAKQRQTRARQRRVSMFEQLRLIGVVPSFNAPMRELAELCTQHDVMRYVTRDEPVTTHGNDEPLTNSSTNVELPSRVTASADGAPPHDVTERAGRVCKLMRKAGINANPGNEALHELLRLGVPDDEFGITAVQAVNREKGFGWVLATIKGRVGDGLAQPPERPVSDAERSARAWAPSLFAQYDAERLKGSQ